ncbi:alpha-ketoacid dehydrogenase subunit beta [Neptunomonas qingdaonensis]|uniref:2-oxoisovalerate dehydrogenase subunit beta n=1 Tax=Neptunomonas qingdaonensis TaxID=1045558 RepID=A0A1I2RZJ7_9GAMM|nr:alpha-ketoacid dehydrogenase subunit beta [Neptunomonas qingdaonensis]SFG46095.1 pyruvate dehydrogenase E1 component beta subunit [Neptunomonas qingdaonensis]
MKSEEAICMVEAINLALHRAMQDDADVILLGEDVATNGGVFRATVGLKEAFGIKRVMDTPLAENMIAGLTVGMAVQGLKPVAEIQFMGFIFPAMEQIVCHAARMRNRTRGRLSCPLVIRAPYGGGIHAPEHHSESTEALFAHIPGLRVVTPSSPQRAYGLLLAAIQNPDPVIFLEPKRIYRSQNQHVEDNGKALPLDTCFTLREGSDISLISWGSMIKETLEAASQLADEDIQCEVIDVATLNPIDRETLLASVGKTGRCVIIHEAPITCSVGSEIASILATEALLDLRAPIARVGGYDTVMPYFRLEDQYMPHTDQIVDAVKRTLEFN